MKRWLWVWILAAAPAVAWGQASTGLPAPSTNGIGGVPIPALATGYLYYNSGTNSFLFQTPGGSGTVNNCASPYALAYYAASGTAVGCAAPFAGLGYFSTSAAPAAATAHNESVPRTCTTTNSGNAYTCTTSPSFTPAAGDTISLGFNAANTGSATLAVNGAAAATIKKWGNSSTLAANDLLAGHWISATFDGTYWQLEGQLGNANATQVNGASVPASVKVLATNASSQPVAASNTLGCLDGWDHLPCTVYEMGVTSESAVTGSYATAYTTPAAGVYRVTGNVYPTTDGTTSYTVSLLVKQQQTGGDASHSLAIASAAVGTSAGWNTPAALTLDLASSVAITWETSGSGTNTSSVWDIDLIVERIK